MAMICLVSRDNGVGLSKDMTLLEDVLRSAGYETVRVDWRAEKLPPCRIAIHLELLNHKLLRGHRNIGVFNLEWFQPRWRRYLPHFDQLWAKSGEAYFTLRRWGLRNVHSTGFAGADFYDPAVPRELSCFHLAGHSNHKNTDAVLSAWAAAYALGEPLPPLTVVSHTERAVPPGVTLLRNIEQAELERELNRHQIHLCPSRAEGWGHYITEALSVAGLVVTTDASPMNEHVQPDHGILIRPHSVGRTHEAAAYAIHPSHIADAVRRAVLLPAEAREKMGQLARAHLLQRNEQFKQNAINLVRRLK